MFYSRISFHILLFTDRDMNDQVDQYLGVGYPMTDETPSEKKSLLARQALGTRSLVLVGLMGAGKSAIGRRLIARLNLPFLDADHEIEAAAGKSIADIFKEHGELYFRDREEKVIERLLMHGPLILATGGGAFMSERTRRTICENGVSLWLKADIDVLMERVGRRDHRPLLQTENPKAVMENLMDERYPVYAQADIIVESRDVAHEIIVGEIINALAQFGET